MELEAFQLSHRKKTIVISLLRNRFGVFTKVTATFGKQKRSVTMPMEMFNGISTIFADFDIRAPRDLETPYVELPEITTSESPREDTAEALAYEIAPPHETVEEPLEVEAPAEAEHAA
jgi:hypothetical protein